MARAKKVSKRTGKRRLLKLADLLLENAKNEEGVKFDIGMVCELNWEQPACFNPKAPVELNCNTTACAMGLASISGAFKRSAKLSYKIEGLQIWNTIHGRIVNFEIAAMRVFGVTKKEALWLFGPVSYPSDLKRGAKGEREVARRIKRIVAGKGIEGALPHAYPPEHYSIEL